MSIQVGDIVPDFELNDQTNTLFQSSEYIGKTNLLIYFYPKDDSPGCTIEACSFRDNIEKFDNLNCMIVGISKDDSSQHDAFSQQYNLPFTLLSDPDKLVSKLFGVKAVIPGVLPGRKTFLINLEGKVSHIFEYQFKPKKHVLEALLALKND